MVKAWCVWCENGQTHSSSGYYWIHMDCASEMMEVSGNIKVIRELLEGVGSRNRFEQEKGIDRIQVVLDFIKDCEIHAKRFAGVNKKFRELGIITSKQPNELYPQNNTQEKKEEITNE